MLRLLIVLVMGDDANMPSGSATPARGQHENDAVAVGGRLKRLSWPSCPARNCDP